MVYTYNGLRLDGSKITASPILYLNKKIKKKKIGTGELGEESNNDRSVFHRYPIRFVGENDGYRLYNTSRIRYDVNRILNE